MNLLRYNFYLLFLTAFVLTGCDESATADDEDDDFTGNMVVYDLESANEDNISGVAIFEEMTDGNTFVTLELNNTVSGESYETHIHENSVAQGGPVAVPLANVDGDTGVSETIIDANQAGGLTYMALLGYDGHVNVHDPDDLSIIVAQANIGANEGDDTDNGNDDDNGDDDNDY